MNKKDYLILIISGNSVDEIKLLTDYNYFIVNDIDLDAYISADYHPYDLIIDFSAPKMGYKFQELNEFNILDIKNTVDKYLNCIKEYEFNKDLALSYLDNNEVVYNNFLKRFISEYENFSSLIKKLLEEQDYLKIREVVHKYKGLTLYLGSTKLYELIDQIEIDIINKKENKKMISYLAYYHDRIMNYAKVENV